MRWLSSLDETIDPYEIFILDIFGLVHNGLTSFPETKPWLEKLRDQKKRVLFVSNSPLLPESVGKTLSKYGVDRSLYQDLLTAGQEASRHLYEEPDVWHARLGAHCYFIGESKMAEGLLRAPYKKVSSLQNADFILLGAPDQPEDHLDDYRDLFKEAVSLKLPMVCANPDLYVFEGTAQHLRAGSYAHFYEELGGDVRYHGKPYPDIYKFAQKRWPELHTKKVLCVGDALDTDIKGASSMNYDSLLLVGPLCLHELGFDAPQPIPAKSLQEKISTQIAKGPYNPTYGLLFDESVAWTSPPR
ncbi:MAG: TIGR01459 family HAD-type hydrolase [Alphaproteobacteria bacterium]|nr:TIGR01459 family HAD-type hydrolase [Alphaproteobacteria bacterium]